MIVEGTRFRVEVRPNGRAKMPVVVTDIVSNKVIWTDAIDVVNAKTRQELVAGFDPVVQAEVQELFDELAAKVALAAKDEAPQETPAPALDPEAQLDAGRAILDAPDQLVLLRSELQRLGCAGETAPMELLYLAFASRLLERPINVTVEGPSAGGKTFAVGMALAFHPPEAVHDLTAMSERALAYSDFDTQHAYVLIGEASVLYHDGTGASIIRELAWGRGLRYETVEKTAEGLRARVIEKPGPTGLVTTSTRPLDPEIATRMLRVQVSDSPEQTAEVLAALAHRVELGEPPLREFATWHAAQRWLQIAGERRVCVPFARSLAKQVPTTDVRMRRDFEQILAVVQVHALLHQRHRDRDRAGHVLADQRDYTAAFTLLCDVLAITLDDVTPETRATVERVTALNEGRSEPGVSCPELAKALKLSKSAASRRAKVARRAGYLVNAEQRKSYPARFIVGEPLPEARAVLPAPEDLFALPESTQRRNDPPKKPVTTERSTVAPRVAPGEGVAQRSEVLRKASGTRNTLRNDTSSMIGGEKSPVVASFRETPRGIESPGLWGDEVPLAAAPDAHERDEPAGFEADGPSPAPTVPLSKDPLAMLADVFEADPVDAASRRVLDVARGDVQP